MTRFTTTLAGALLLCAFPSGTFAQPSGYDVIPLKPPGLQVRETHAVTLTESGLVLGSFITKDADPGRRRGRLRRGRRAHRGRLVIGIEKENAIGIEKENVVAGSDGS